MKPFDLHAALAGEPVRLRGGYKAHVIGKIPNNLTYDDNEPIDYPLVGIVLDENGYLTDAEVHWTINGSGYKEDNPHDSDIIGMWEEPKLTTEEIMEKAFQEKLIIRHSLLLPYHKGFKVVGKTRDGDYILQDCDGSELSFLCVFNKDIEWSIGK